MRILYLFKNVVNEFKAVSQGESLFHQFATYNTSKCPSRPGQTAPRLQAQKPSCSALPASLSLGQPASPTPLHTTRVPSCSEGCRESMHHVQADVTETASPESAGETLGMIRGWGEGSKAPPRSFQNTNFSGTEKEGRQHSNNWLWAVSNPV